MSEFLKPFDYIKSLYNKEYVMLTPEIEAGYNAFIINRGISMNLPDSLYAHKMNMYYNLPNNMQYDYYFYSLRKGYKFSQWCKEQKYDKLQYVIDFYKCSKSKAIRMLDLLTDDQVNQIEKRLTSFGGLKSKNKGKK